MADTIVPSIKRAVPIWNKAPLTCPLCARHFAIATIRMVKHDGEWVCHGCALKATETSTPARARRIAVDPEHPEHSCATCGVAIGKRRSVTNVHGATVHYRCPKKTSPNRARRH